MEKLTNLKNVPISIAAWLAFDQYRHERPPKGKRDISATALLKSLRAIELTRRMADEEKELDVIDLVASNMGTAVHSNIEKIWSDGHWREALLTLGYSQEFIDRIEIYPEPGKELSPDAIPVHFEFTNEKKVGDWTVSGTLDFCMDGILEDIKTCSVWSWIFKSSIEEWRFQGSIYRWLNPDIVTEDIMRINCIFKDWSEFKAKSSADYPNARIAVMDLTLIPLQEIERWIAGRLRELERIEDLPEKELPLCTDVELWRESPKWKYYKKPGSSRATKVFDNEHGANQAVIAEGGVVIKFPGAAKRCKYCTAAPVCSQRAELAEAGLLKN